MTTNLTSAPNVSDSESATVLSNTVIISIAVAAYVLFCILVCFMYQCIKRRGNSPSSATLLTCANCLDCDCLLTLNERSENSWSWCQRPLPSVDAFWGKCCPDRVDTGNFEQLCLCQELNCAQWKGVSCCKSDPNCAEPSRFMPNCCRIQSEESVCGYDNGDCRLCCLECKVRTRKKAAPTAASVTTTGALPVAVTDGKPIFTIQPDQPHNFPFALEKTQIMDILKKPSPDSRFPMPTVSGLPFSSAAVQPNGEQLAPMHIVPPPVLPPANLAPVSA